ARWECRIGNNERKAVAISDRIPIGIIAEVEDRFAHWSEQNQTVSGVVEAAGIFAGDPTPRAVARFKCRPIPHDHNRFAGRQHHGSERLESDQWIIELDFIGKSAVPGDELDSSVAERSAGK